MMVRLYEVIEASYKGTHLVLNLFLMVFEWCNTFRLRGYCGQVPQASDMAPLTYEVEPVGELQDHTSIESRVHGS